MTSDKTDSLRRDLLLSNFERIREMTEDESDSTYLLTPSPSAPTLTDKRKITTENRNRNKKSNKKMIHTNASPAEVFHRNLVDAVSNVDDSDENEHYVYPYSGNETDLNRPLSVQSTPLYEDKSTNWFQALTKSNKEYMNDHRKQKRFYPPPRRRQRYPIDGYASDDEEMPLIKKRQQGNRKSRNKSTCSSYLFFIPFSILIFIIIMILYTAKPLQHLQVEIGRVLATDKELIFDLKVEAENVNAWTVQINECDLSVFAFSQIVPNSINMSQLVADPAEYLGGLHHFDEPLSIYSNLLSNKRTVISQIRIKSPGADDSGNERWSRMIRYPYGLVVRGVMKYHLIPFIYPSQSLTVCHVSRIDPTTGAVTMDPDKKSFCHQVVQ